MPSRGPAQVALPAPEPPPAVEEPGPAAKGESLTASIATSMSWCAMMVTDTGPNRATAVDLGVADREVGSRFQPEPGHHQDGAAAAAACAKWCAYTAAECGA